MEALEYEVKALHIALEQVQATLTSPELARQSLKEQLFQRQVITTHCHNPGNTLAALLQKMWIVNGFISICL